jgi:hypothetical protein
MGYFSVVVTSGLHISKPGDLDTHTNVLLLFFRSRAFYPLPEGECGRNGRKEARTEDSGCYHLLFTFPYFLDLVCP